MIIKRPAFHMNFAVFIRLVSHTHTHTIEVIVDVRMTSGDVIVGIGMMSLPVYAHTVCDTRLVFINSGSCSLIYLRHTWNQRVNTLEFQIEPRA